MEKIANLKNTLLSTLLSLYFLTANAQKTLFPKSEYNKGGIFKSEKGKYGLKKESGEVMIPARYDSIDYLPDNSRVGVYSILLNGKWGFIDTTGKEITPVIYDDIHPFKDGMAAVKRNGKWGFINPSGKEVIKAIYDEAFDYFDGLAVIKQNGKWGCVDKTGKLVIAPQYDIISGSKEMYFYGESGFDNGYAFALSDKGWGMFDKSGKEVIPFKYDDIDQLSLNPYLVSLKLNGKWGFADKNGNIRLPIKYDSLAYEGFNESMLAITVGKKWGYTDTTGKEVISMQYDHAHLFKGGKAKVKKDGREFHIDKSGNEIKHTADNNKGPVALQGNVDPSLIGTWKFSSSALNITTYYIFKADGTYDYYVGNITPTNTLSAQGCYWRVHDEVLEFACPGHKEAQKYNFRKRNDPATGKPALVIEWKGAPPNERMYVTTDNKSPWK